MVLTSDGRYTEPLAIPANEAHIAGNLRTLSEFSVPEINKRLRSYLKFIFVRDPFERLVSAYRNKFTRNYNTAFHKRYGTKIIRRHRANPEPKALREGNDVSFQEFVQYLVDPRTQREEPFNEHWERVHSLCHPCLIHYDVVGKYETLEPDAQAVLRLAGVEGTIKFPTSGKSTRTDSNMAAHFFKHISPFYQKKLFNLYRMDFLLFNYSTPEYLRTRWWTEKRGLTLVPWMDWLWYFTFASHSDVLAMTILHYMITMDFYHPCTGSFITGTQLSLLLPNKNWQLWRITGFFWFSEWNFLNENKFLREKEKTGSLCCTVPSICHICWCALGVNRVFCSLADENEDRLFPKCCRWHIMFTNEVISVCLLGAVRMQYLFFHCHFSYRNW